MSENILKQEYIVTSSFDEDMAISALVSQLKSRIFKDLIKREKFGIKLTFTLETIDSEPTPIHGKEAKGIDNFSDDELRDMVGDVIAEKLIVPEENIGKWISVDES